jgi:hypothetical protein
MASQYCHCGSNKVNTRSVVVDDMSNSSQSQVEERRTNTRHPAGLRVQLLRNDTIPVQLHTVELSMGGMHIECDREQAQLLAPPDIGEGRQFTARILLSVPGSARRALTLSAVVKTVVQLGPDHYRIGLYFERFFGKSRESLADFILMLEN